MDKMCVVCGKFFVAITYNNRYCSKECKLISKRQQAKECYYRNHEKNLLKAARIRERENKEWQERLLKLPELLRTKGKRPRLGKILRCPICQKEYYVRPSALKNKRYCSWKCRGEAQKKRKYLICEVCGKEYSVSQGYFAIRGSRYCSYACKGKWQSKTIRGKNSTNWKGGISSEGRRLRNSKKWKDWRKAVFERDNYTCRECGNHGGYLEPHHIKPFAYFKELRFSVENGITLCKECHQKTKLSGSIMQKMYGDEKCL